MKSSLISFLIGVLFSAFSCAAEIVTPETYILAEVDLYFKKLATDVGLNVFSHNQTHIPFTKQEIASNQDIAYSLGLFYAPKGTTITLPQSKDGRYQSAMVMQNDHYISQVFYGHGKHDIESNTDFVAIIIRTHIDINNAEDMEYVNTLQSKVVITQPKGVAFKTFEPHQWDIESMEILRAQFKHEGKAPLHLNTRSAELSNYLKNKG
jgi:hypothetical protein